MKQELPILYSPLALTATVTLSVFLNCFTYLVQVESIILYLSFLLSAYFTSHNVLKVHPYYSMCQNFLPFKSWMIFHCMVIPHFVYPLICLEHRLFISFTYCGNAAMNMGVQIFLWDFFNSFGHVPRGRIPGSYGNFILNFLRNHHTVFHSGCFVLQSHR